MAATVKSRLPAVANALKPRVDHAVKATAERVAADAKDRAPVNTGALRDAIHVQRTGDSEYAVIAGDNDVFYGHMVEHGTSHTAPRPFLIPALEAARSEIVQAARAAVRSL